MDFEKLMQQGYSKSTNIAIAHEIQKHQNRIDDLMVVLKTGEQRAKVRASWAMSVLAEKEPDLLVPYIPLFISLMKDPKVEEAVTRGICRSLQFMEIPEKHEGRILDIMFQLMNSNSQPIAVRVFSMQVVYNLSKKYAEIIPELKASILAILPNGSAGMKSRGNKILKRIEQQ